MGKVIINEPTISKEKNEKNLEKVIEVLEDIAAEEKENKNTNDDFEFIIVTPTDEESITNFHKSLAQGLINKHGIKTMKKVVELSNQPNLKIGEKSLKEYKEVVTFDNGKRKIIVTHRVTGIDKRKEAADVVLKNIRENKLGKK